MARHRSRKPTYYSCGSMVAKDAAKALTMARGLKKLINVEYKSINNAVNTTPDSTGTVSTVTNLAQGDDTFNRDGNKIRLFSVKMAGQATIHASARATNLRLMLVQDRSGTTTIPAITDLFTSVAAFAAGQPNSGGPQVNSRFKVIFDKKIVLSDNGKQNQYFDVYRKLSGHTYFTGTAATDEGRNGLYLFTASNEAAAGNEPAVSATIQLKWIDN